ncbi:MAG: translation initiation factor IF-2 subunit beta [Desulfurococcales archaeon]|nr:translation initiation factor IF-2 subunit beta [Desulfurococcales archaeon]MEB3845639.1 translation initiation factor IF-2 subunit beta [Desulfurococcales archaeon]
MGDELVENYDALLNRLYSKVPAKKHGHERFEMPKVEVIHMGSQTIIRNFREISDKLRRNPEILSRYFLKELATAGNYDPESGILKVNIRVSSKSLNLLLEKFVKSYVICPTCGRPDTILIKKGKTWILVCEACGAEQPVKPI